MSQDEDSVTCVGFSSGNGLVAKMGERPIGAAGHASPPRPPWSHPEAAAATGSRSARRSQGRRRGRAARGSTFRALSVQTLAKARTDEYARKRTSAQKVAETDETARRSLGTLPPMQRGKSDGRKSRKSCCAADSPVTTFVLVRPTITKREPPSGRSRQWVYALGPVGRDGPPEH